MSMDEGIGMKFWLALTACLLHFAANAAEVTADEAREAVAGWASLQEALTGGPGFRTSEISGVKTCSGADGKGLYYVVSFEYGGYAVASGDMEMEPILAYSADGEWIDDAARNPLKSMIDLDVAAWAEASSARASAAAGGTKRLLTASAAVHSRSAARWAKLRGAAGSASSAPSSRKLLAASMDRKTDADMEAGDLRAGPFLKSKWNQGSVRVNGVNELCYNSYTPLNSVCGCVATMGAQIMYYHKWPQSAVTFGKTNRNGENRWSYGGIVQFRDEDGGIVNGYWELWSPERLKEVGTYDQGIYMSNGYNINGYQATLADAQAGRRNSNYVVWDPAFGGVYDWAAMPAVPSAAGSTDGFSEIGRLCRDVGLAAVMNYELGGSGSNLAKLALPLVDTFQYADAKFKSSPTAEDVRNVMLSNFDAGLPVGVAVPGHAIAADGYGYVAGNLYVHFNFGWSGSSDGWYLPPVLNEDVYIGAEKYNTFNQLLYNVYPKGEEGYSIVSGRVVDKDGNPVAGIVVSAGGSRSDTTDSNGVYALFVAPGKVSMSAVSVSTIARTNLTVAACTNPYIFTDGVVNEGKNGQYSSVGNVWGVDLVLEEASESELGWINETADTTGLTGEWSNGIAYDQTTRRAELSGENTFTPLLPSGGNAAMLEFTAKFDALTDDLTGMDSDAQMAFCIGANGKFRLWSAGGWVEVSADGVTPASDVEYAVRVVFNYKSGCYSASVRDSGGAFRPLLDGDGNGSFAIAADASHVGSVIMRGYCVFSSLVGTYYTVSGFSPGDVTGEDAQITLSEAHAAWLNALAENRGYMTVSNGVARLSAARFETAYLCNLDVTRDDFDATFGVTGIAVDDEKVAIEVTLERTGAMQSGGKDAPINGVLRFYGAATVDAFRSALPSMKPLADITLTNDDFADGDAATAEIERPADPDVKFFKAGIGVR